MELPKHFISGDVVDMQTTEETITFRMLDLNDPDWINFNWDFPWCPLDVESDHVQIT